jgi:two-component system, LytTR family, response regulator LytT
MLNCGHVMTGEASTMDLSILAQLPQILEDWIPETASIAVANRQEYILYRPGDYDLNIHPGEAVPPGSVASRVFQTSTRVELEVDSSVFGIPYHGLGYPIRTEDGFQAAVTVILPPRQRKQNKPLTFVMGLKDNVWYPIPIEQIAYFESYEKKTWVYTNDGAFVTNHTLQSLEDRLSSDAFVRIHRSYIVNISFIHSIRRDLRSNLVVSLRLGQPTHLPVSQSYVRHVRESLEF